MRYLEWLCPILRYVRLRREAPAWRVWLTAIIAPILVVLALLSPMICVIMVEFLSGRGFSPSGPGSARVLDDIASLVREYASELAVTLASTCIVLLVLAVLAFVIAIIFVRKQPGRRRPLCTWQTFKFVLLAGQTWFFLTVLGVLTGWGIFFLAEQYPGPRESASLAVATGIGVLLFGVPIFFIGATAVHAAKGVIALQDDRRCQQCGYFLIHLTSPRCPECGTPFDPAKLGKLAMVGEAGDSVRG